MDTVAPVELVVSPGTSGGEMMKTGSEIGWVSGGTNIGYVLDVSRGRYVLDVSRGR